MYKRISAALAMTTALLFAPALTQTASADVGYGGFCETLIDRSQQYTYTEGVIVLDQWHYAPGGSSRCWQIHHAGGARMKALVEITTTNERTGVVRTKQVEFDRSYAQWGCHKLGRNKIVDVEVWVNTDGDGKYDDGWLKVNLNAH